MNTGQNVRPINMYLEAHYLNLIIPDTHSAIDN